MVKVFQIKKPIIHQETKLAQSVREILFKDLPINEWCMKQDKKRKL